MIYRLRQEAASRGGDAAAQRDHFEPDGQAILNLPGLEQGPREDLRDVGDHLGQVAGELQRQIDDLMSLTGTYFNANADRLTRSPRG